MQRFFRGLFIVIALLAGCAEVEAAPLSSGQAVERARAWMQGHPIMGSVADNAVRAVTAFPADAAPDCVYVVELSPGGYLVLSADDRLAPVIAFDAASAVNLEDRPDNAFRAFLANYAARLPAGLRALPADAPRYAPQAVVPLAAQTCGPYMTTTWNQTNPYNLYAPSVTGGMNGYDGRAPIGCTPTALGQIMYYHRWPGHGVGTISHTDSSGSCTGSYQADLSQPFDWFAMKNGYDSGLTSEPGGVAVGDLLFRMAVASDADFEANGTRVSVIGTAAIMAQNLFYEAYSWRYTSNPDAFDLLNSDLRAGYPCGVGLPDHAVVADGLMTDTGADSYHINYGWGGKNNGWWTASGIPGGSMQYVVTGLRPRLLAFPETTNTVHAAAGASVPLHWILPQRRESEVAQINIKRFVSSGTGGHWETYAVDTTLAKRVYSESRTLISECASLSGWTATATGTSLSPNWTATTEDGATCFYKAPREYNGYSFRLTSTSAFSTAAGEDLVLRVKRRIVGESFNVYVSTSAGSFPSTPFATFGGRVDWMDEVIPLGSFAGQSVYIRLEYVGSASYTDGGIWIDRIETFTTVNPELRVQPIHDSVITAPQEPGTYRFAATLTDTNGVEHGIADEFSLVASPFVFQVQPDGSALLVSYSGTASKVEIPSEWEGHPVTAIAAHVFASAPNLRTLIIPASVVSLGTSALAGDALVSVYFLGAAPATQGTVFGLAAPPVPLVPTVYFRHGAAGFSDSFASRPALLWNPVFTGTSTLGASGFGLSFAAHTNLGYVIEYKAALTQQVWTVLSTNYPPCTNAVFTDPVSAPARFYRVRALDPE